MPEAEITVQFVNLPKPGKKMGSIKSSEGQYYGCPPNLLHSFGKGEVCKIEYDTSPKKGGGEWLNLKRKISSVSIAPKSAQYRAASDPGESEKIFVTALLKEIIQADDGPQTVTDKVNMLRKVYANTFGGSMARKDDAMDDEIPY